MDKKMKKSNKKESKKQLENQNLQNNQDENTLFDNENVEINNNEQAQTNKEKNLDQNNEKMDEELQNSEKNEMENLSENSVKNMENSAENANESEEKSEEISDKHSDLDKLKSFKIREISTLTHIEDANIENILNKNFAPLLNLNVKGFIKILEREYELDLSDWMEEFEIYKSQNAIDKKSSIQQISISRSSKESRKVNWKLWFLLLILIIAGIFYFKIYDKVDLVKILDGEKNTTYLDSSVVSEAQKKLESIGINPLSETTLDNKPQNVTNNATQPNETLNALDLSIKIERENLQNSLANEANATENNATISEAPSVATLKPSGKIWIGIIDMQTGKKTETTTDKPYEINLLQDSLIVTGHGVYTLENGEEIEKSEEKHPVRMRIENGKISKITYDEFLRLNKGKSW